MDNKTIEDLRNTIACLESKVDYLHAELSHINVLLLEIGFPDGICGLKSTIEELLKLPDLEDFDEY